MVADRFACLPKKNVLDNLAHLHSIKRLRRTSASAIAGVMHNEVQRLFC